MGSYLKHITRIPLVKDSVGGKLSVFAYKYLYFIPMIFLKDILPGYRILEK